MLKIRNKSDDPKILVVTPLLPGHEISRDTRTTIKRNRVLYDWITYTDNNNIPTNCTNAINTYKEKFGYLPQYYLMIDNDIVLGRNMIDKLYNCLLSFKSEKVAYAYASFEFKGAVNKKFPAIPFNPKKLIEQNYISSNSMIKMKNLIEIGGLVTDEKYERLLDWCLWLKFLKNGMYGVNCPSASFIAVSSEDDISAGSREDYLLKYQRVIKDFIKPMEGNY